MALDKITEEIREDNRSLFNPKLFNVELLQDLSKNLPAGDLPEGATPLDTGFVPISDQPASYERKLGPLYDPTLDNQELLALRQSGLQQWVNFIPRVGVKILSEVAQIPGYLGGVGDWATTGFDPAEIGRMVDNGWINAIKSAEEEVKDAFPVFVPKSVQEGGLWKNITSAAFWASEGADGVGFLMSMLVPGQALKALKAGEAIASLPKLFRPAYQTSIAAAGRANMMAAATINTFYESVAEAGESFRDMMAQTGDKQKAGEAAVQTMKANFLILLGPNMLQQKWLYGGFKRVAGKSVGKEALTRAQSRIMGEGGNILEAVAARTAWDKIGSVARKGLKGVISEGFFEEGFQFAAAEYAKEKATAGEEGSAVEDLLGTLETYVDSLSDTDMQKSIFLGAILGGGMASISGVRDVQQEERTLRGQGAKTRTGIQKFIGLQDRKETKGLHSLLQNKYIPRNRTYMDFVKKDSEGNPIIKDGKYDLDLQKLKEGGIDQLNAAMRNQKMATLAQLGDREGFETLKMQGDFDYMFTFLQQPGGLDLLKVHINHLAKSDAEASLEDSDTGTAPQEMIDEIKKDLLDKAEKFQKIVNKIENRHELNFRIRHDPTDNSIFNDFSDLVKTNKYTEAANQDHSIRRINALTKELNTYQKGDQTIPITSEDGTTEGFKQSLDEQRSKLSSTDIDIINKNINDIETHKKLLEESKTREKDLYSPKKLQQQYTDYLDDNKEIEQDAADAKENAKKDSSTAQLDPMLQGLYDNNVKHESITVGLEEYDAKHSAELEVSYKNKEGEFETTTVSLVGPTTKGDLRATDNNKSEIFIKSDNTIRINGELYDIEDIEVKKSVDDVIKERHTQARLNVLENSIQEFQDSVIRNENEIKRGIDYIQELYDRLNKLQQKEIESLKKYGTALTRKGASRVESIKVLRGRGKRISQMYMTADQIQKEIDYISEEVRRLENLRNSRVERLAQLEAEKEQVLLSDADQTMGEIMNNNIDLLKDQVSHITNFADATTAALHITDDYLKKLRGVMRGYNRTAARLLGISDRIDFIRNSDMMEEDKDRAEFEAISSALHATDGLTDEFNEIDGVIKNILSLRTKITEAEDTYTALMADLVKHDEQRERLDIALRQKNAMRNKFYETYRDTLDKLGLLSSNIDKQAAKNITLEPEYKDFATRHQKDTEDFERDYKHPFVDQSSWLVTQGNQQALTNPEDYNYTDEDLNDISRWRVFVDKNAYKKIPKDKDKKKRFLLRSFSYDIVASLSPDDVLRTKLKFWAGITHGFKSYNELLDLDQEARDAAKNDIKVVVYDRISGKPKILLTGKAGNIAVDKKTEIAFTSLPTAELTTANAERFAKGGEIGQRFSTKEIRNQKLKELMKEAGVTEATTKLKDEADNYAQGVLQKSAESYKETREALKEVSMFFNIDSTTPGVKNYTDAGYQEIEAATGIKAVALHITAPSKKEASIKISGTRFTRREGYLYITNNNRVEPIRPKTFGETESIEDVVNLFRALATNPEERTTIEQYIKQIMNMNNSDTKFRIAFVRPAGIKGLMGGEFTKISFGEGQEITKEQLANNEGLAEFKEFLKDKYWNFDFNALRASSFTELKAVDRKGTMVIQSRTWSKGDGAYKGFLFSPANDNKTKGMIYVSPRPENDFQATRKPQYKNQALILSEASSGQEIEGTVIPDVAGVVPIEELLGLKKGAPVPTAEEAPPEADESTEALLVKLGIKEAPVAKEEGSSQKIRVKHKIRIKKDADERSKRVFGEDQIYYVASLKTNNKNHTKLIPIEEMDKPEGDRDVHGLAITMAGIDLEVIFEVVPEEKPTPSSKSTTELTDQDIFDALGIKPETVVEETPVKENTTDEILTEEQPIISSGTLFQDADSYWEHLKQNNVSKYNYYKNRVANEDDAKARAFRRYQDQNKESNLDREVTKSRKYKLANSTAENNWFTNKFKDFPFHAIEGLIDGKSWGQFNAGSRVLISNLAAEGTVYHEGFHVVSQIFLTPQEREELYTETRKVLKLTNKTDKQIEEILAEEFREYMMADGNYKFGKTVAVRKNLFQKILDLLLHFYNSIFNTDAQKPSQILELFENINDTEFLLKDRKSWSSETLDRRVEGFSETETIAYVKDINFKFFKILFGETEVIDEAGIFELERIAPDIYQAIKDKYEDAAFDGELASKDILEHWDDLVNLHKEYLLQYQVDIIEELDEDERTKDSYNYNESNTTSMKDVTPKAIRLTIAGLPSVTRNGEGKVDLTYSDFDTNSTVAYDKIMNTLLDELSNISTLWGMINKLNSLKTKYPELGVLYKRLGSPKPNNLDSLSDTQFKLLGQFYKGFSNNKNTPWIYYFDRKGKKNIINAVDNENVSAIKNGWLNFARDIAGSSASYITKDKSGAYFVDKDKFIAGAMDMVKTKKDKDKITKAINIIRRTGLMINDDATKITNYTVLESYIKRTAEELHKSKNPVTLKDFFDPNVIKSQGETKKLLAYSAGLVVSGTELGFINQDGKREYSITLNSHVSNALTRLNEWADDVENDIEVRHIVDENMNPFATHSVWKEALRTTDSRIKLVLLRGAKSRADGKDTSSLNETDYKAFMFNSILENAIPLLRAAERKLEYGFYVDETDYTITDSKIVQQSINYLKDELLTSFSLLSAEKRGENLANYRTHARSLRTFDYLYDKEFTKGIRGNLLSLEDYMGDQQIPDAEVLDPKALTEKFISDNKVFIEEAIKKYINKSIDLNIQSLVDSDVVIYQPTQKGYAVPGIDPALMDKANIKYTFGKLIDASAMRQLAKIVYYNYFVGTQEQLKLLLGDLAMYKNVEDFHKRTTGSVSTKNKLINDAAYTQETTARYTRFDGYEESTALRKVVYADIFKPKDEVSSDALEVSSKYAEANGVDSQTWVTLDGYRSLLLKDASWMPGNEKTYQYEMQLLGIKLLQDKELQEIFPFSEEEFTREDGMFYKHTDGKVPTTPMYYGKELRPGIPGELTPLPPLKPQGFGNIDSVEDLYATQFYKLSMAPIFPSLLSRDMLKHFLSMSANGVDAFGFITADKATYSLLDGKPNQLYDKDGNIQLMSEGETVAPQSISYDDFGIQLEIAEDPKGRTSRATQRERLEHSDMFELGRQIVDSDLVDKYHQVINDIASTDFQTLLDETGITKNGEEYELTEDNAEKFGKTIEKLYHQRRMPYNLIDGIHEVLKSDLKLFDTLVNKNKIEEVLLAMVRNRLIRRKITGEMLIQESSFLYFGNDLKFYKKGAKKTEAMEVAIPVPKAWAPLIQAKGGISYLNNLLNKTRDPKTRESALAKIRKDFGDLDKALLISGVRIPVQGINSMESMRIVRFLPTYVGNKILMPHEVTIKAGSDFDIDKLTTYFANLKVKGGKFVYQTEGKSGLENKLNEMSFESVLHPERLQDFLTPNHSDLIKKLADDIVAKRKKTDLEIAEASEGWSKATQLWYNFNKAAQFWRSKGGISLAASHNKSIPTHQQHPVKIEDPNVKLFFGGQYAIDEVDTASYTSGHVYDSDGRKISMNFSQFLTAFVDAAKDPRVFELNTAQGAFNVYAFLNKFGRSSSIGLETIAHFMTQDVILDYLQKSRNAYSLTLRTGLAKKNQRYNSDIVTNIFKKLDAAAIKGVPTTYEQTLAVTYRDYFQAVPGTEARAKAAKNLQDKLNNYTYEPLSKEVLKSGKLSNKQKIQILDNFLSYQFFGQQLSRLNQISNGDAKLEQNLNSLESKYVIQDELMTNGFFNPDDISELLNSGLLKPFTEIRDKTRDLFSWAFTTKKYPAVNLFFNERFIKPFTKKIFKEEDRVRALRQIESDFITYIIETAGKSYKSVRNEYDSIFFGPNNGATQLARTKKQIKGNELINELEPVIKEFDRNTNEPSSMDYISTFNRRADLFTQNSYTSAWHELLENPDKDVVQFAQQRIKQALYQSGVAASPIAHLQYAPNSAYMDLAEGALARFTQFPMKLQVALMMSFEEQMYRNNWNNPLIVSRRESISPKFEEKWEPYGIREKDPLNQYFVRVFSRPGRDEGFYSVLYKKRGGVFVAVKKLGNGFKFKEYYPLSVDDINSENFKSLYATNNDLGMWEAENTGSNFQASALPTDIPTNQDYENDYLASFTKEELLEDYAQAPSSESKDQFGIEDQLAVPADPELNQVAKDFYEAVGIEYEAVDEIIDSLGIKVPKAVAKASIAQKTVQAVEGKLAIHHLPEEAAHIYVSMLPNDSGLKKSMFRSIENYGIYDKVKQDYADIYETEEQFKREAVGQLIAQHMVQLSKGKDMVHSPELTERQHSQVNTWWSALWAQIRKMFGLNTPYQRSAYNIMNIKLEDLTRKAEELGSDPDLYALDSLDWNELFADKQIGNVKYIYFRTTSQAEEYMKQAQKAFGTDNVFMSPAVAKELAKVIIKNPVRKNRNSEATAEVIAERNFKEYKKESIVSNSKAEVLENFEKYYAALTYMNPLEREAFVDALTLGELEQICGI